MSDTGSEKFEPEAGPFVCEPRVHVSTAKPKAPLTEEELANMEKPKVLIVGAGIGGLMLANLLQKGNIPYEVYERNKVMKPFGSAMSLGSCFKQLFQQLEIYEEFEKIGKPNHTMELFNSEMKSMFVLDSTARETITGGVEYIVARPDLYNLLLHQIPKERIHMGKKVMSFLQNDGGVMIRCSDNSTVQGDILVGADGTYSGVRQHLYKTLKEKKVLPASDEQAMPFTCICLVGQTDVLDPEEFPGLKQPQSQFVFVVGEEDYSLSTLTTITNRICWFVIRFLDKESSREHDPFRSSEWGPEQAEAMCREVRHFKVPIGKEGAIVTMGDLINKTPKDLISKVMLEEKLFETWHGGRTVLLGDSCHKLNPAGGAGALTAIQDAVALGNWICALQAKDKDGITRIFKEYRDERYPVVKAAFATSQVFRNLGGTNLKALLTRMVFKNMPKWLMEKVIIRRTRSRPQVSFLPLLKDNGSVPPMAQPSLEKTLPIIKARLEAELAKAESAQKVVANAI
ncbi:hypothetical protein BG005_000740 [Podila minutissima]|nr:hypothetical protein BG005_000740 [Podila minutissima]